MYFHSPRLHGVFGRAVVCHGESAGAGCRESLSVGHRLVSALPEQLWIMVEAMIHSRLQPLQDLDGTPRREQCEQMFD